MQKMTELMLDGVHFFSARLSSIANWRHSSIEKKIPALAALSVFG
jgi:hypothetical protein